MKPGRSTKIALLLLALFAVSTIMPSCGTTHGYWGVENDYYSDGYHRHHYKKPKPPKHKKHKKHKHHHDHDDDDDD